MVTRVKRETGVSRVPLSPGTLRLHRSPICRMGARSTPEAQGPVLGAALPWGPRPLGPAAPGGC